MIPLSEPLLMLMIASLDASLRYSVCQFLQYRKIQHARIDVDYKNTESAMRQNDVPLPPSTFIVNINSESKEFTFGELSELPYFKWQMVGFGQHNETLVHTIETRDFAMTHLEIVLDLERNNLDRNYIGYVTKTK